MNPLDLRDISMVRVHQSRIVVINMDEQFTQRRESRIESRAEEAAPSKTGDVGQKARAVQFVIWIAVTVALLRLCIWISAEILLLRTYGRARVFSEHLHLVKIKPDLIVSNGDVLWGKGFQHFLISGVMWLPAALFAMIAISSLLPQWCRDGWKGSERSIGGLGLVFGLGLFFVIFLLPLPGALSLATLVVIGTLAWARRRQTQ